MSSQPSSLIECIEYRKHRILKFLTRHEDLHAVIDAGLVIAHGLAKISTVSSSPSKTKLWCGLLWQRIAEYQQHSIELILAGELDAGMALLRMAAELARDVAVIGKDESQFAVWKNREAASEIYRKRFKFDQSPSGRAAHRLYKFASRFGVHGHQTTIAQARASAGEVSEGGVLYFEIDDDAPLQVMDVWLGGFFPLHSLCATAVGVDDPERYEIFVLFLSFVQSLKPVLEEVKERRETRRQRACL